MSILRLIIFGYRFPGSGYRAKNSETPTAGEWPPLKARQLVTGNRHLLPNIPFDHSPLTKAI
ncbi:hypothetical protein A3860_26275 [Niastella vici]|uniref:Uncharacterized protein n=1 Tax=Niastella vici TaxID=1703345 RepID=A0A1V9FWT2_9BACT|nr:hypothetical protein A3860_26275 [Niastella vici]